MFLCKTFLKITSRPNKIYHHIPTASVGNFKRSQGIALKESGNFIGAADELTNFLKENRPLSIDEWTQIRANLLKTTRSGISDYNIDAIILGQLGQCMPNHQLNVAKSYIQFLHDTNRNANLATIGRYLRLFYHSAINNDKTNPSINDANKKEIIDLYQQITKESDILDSVTCDNLIHALILTDKWQDTFKLLEMIKITTKPSSSPYNVIIAKTFKENQFDIGWKLLNEMIRIDRSPNCNVFLSYFHAIDNQSIEKIEEMLSFIGENRIMVSRRVVEELQTIYQQIGHDYRFTTVQTNGKCNACRNHLTPVKLTNNEFQRLSSEFLEKVLIRNNVFLKTNPQELTRFQKFINQTRPYDCVIDGLNVAYSTGSKNSTFVPAKLTAAVVKYFVQANKCVLVIGRNHMNNWPKTQLNYIRKNSHLFLTENLSQDDPFLLWATLKSGPNTDFCSRDLMRSHAHLLGAELKVLFRRWQQQHQYFLDKVAYKFDDTIRIQQPVTFDQNAHKNKNNCWHIPFTEEYTPQLPDSFDLQPNWLCISMRNKLA